MKSILRTILLGLILSGAPGVSADIPVSYYNSVNGRADADLKTALSNLIYNHTEVSSYQNLPNYFRRTDVRPGTDYWWDMYSDLEVSTSITFGTYMNREHSFPKSWWGGLTTIPAYVDLNHLYPSEAKANQAKSNYPLGIVYTSATSVPKFDNGVVKVGYPTTGIGGGATLVFEPSDEYKGDFARTYFYMVTCYQDLTWDTKYMYMLEQNTYPTLKSWAVDMLLEWNRIDPVSEKETMRNDEVYKIQNNRNPFIDYPELAEYIWGNKMGTKFYAGSGEPSGTPELINPVQGTSLDFGQVAIGKDVVSRLVIKGENLRGSVSVQVYGTDAAMFSIPTATIASTLANAEGGYLLPVTYKPTSIGSHNARLLVSDGGTDGSVGIALIGECLSVPTLTAPTATAASDITNDSYVANWEVPDEVVDYYIVSRTRYESGSSSSEDILAESNSLLIEDFSGPESYNVRSVRLGYESARSNEIFVEPAGVTGVEADSPLGWARWPGGVRIVCGEPHSGCRVYDLAGRLIRSVGVVEDNTIIELSPGAYFIVTDQCSTPLRILVSQ